MRHDHKEAAALLTWAGVDLFVVSGRMLAACDEQSALEMQMIAIGLKEAEDRLVGYADEVKAGRIVPRSVPYKAGRCLNVDVLGLLIFEK